MKISTLGFPLAEESKLGKILPLSKNQQYSLHPFDLATLADAVLVFGDTEAYAAELNCLSDTPVKIAVVAKQAPTQAGYYHLPYPLVASRVLRVLDTLFAPVDGQQSPSDLGGGVPETAATAVPLEIIPDLQKRSPPQEEAPAVLDGLPNYQVLVVDDSVPMQKALELELAKLEACVQIDFAGSGEEALELTANKEYDFIFLDIMMPGIDGFEACSQMRKRPNMKKVPIIMLSAKTSPMDEVRGVISGCTTYLVKPIVHEEFQKVVLRITKWVDNFRIQQGLSS
jgi:two-component system cell cycle response regulator